MSNHTQSPIPSQAATLKAYVEKIKAQVHEAKATLDLFEAAAQKKKAQADIAAIGKLKASKASIEKKLQDLGTTHEAHVARAKADINEGVTTLKATVDALATKLKSHSTTK